MILIQPSYDGREAMKAVQGCRSLGVDWRTGKSDTAGPDCVPVGDVEFCERVLSEQGFEQPTPDFYPDFLRDWMHRMHSLVPDGSSPDYWKSGGFFCKSADRYKAFPAHITQAGHEIPAGNLWLVEPVTFIQEWRYYIVDGEVLATGWYDGEDEDEPAPALPIAWPKTFSAAADFGRLADGKIALVESHHPYACGWYGDDSEMWVLWLIGGWRSLVGK